MLGEVRRYQIGLNRGKTPFLDCDAHLRTELGVLGEVRRSKT